MKDYLLIHISEGYEYTDRCQINIVPVMPWEAFNFTGMVWFHMSSSREGSNQYKVILNDYDETFLSWLKWFLPGWQYSNAQSTLNHQFKLFWWIMVAQHLIKTHHVVVVSWICHLSVFGIYVFEGKILLTTEITYGKIFVRRKGKGLFCSYPWRMSIILGMTVGKFESMYTVFICGQIKAV